ncbi:SIMPL domain-containing protein [Niabella beijingensis]|uniref:SIMPL domain-containing protein n=1 Tax=Niabella beijingensis TaxID=2872700 RepID=UPI001CBF3158|nr:SIMPL domain-containing protein [Niabella beijingensis]MBZ4189673.1 SIMPL domain-containing protein [Niabella beijingensis]
MRYITFTAAAALLFAACNTTPQQDKIRVTGEGKVRVMPDQVILTISVLFTQPRMADAVKMTQETVDSVSAILEQFGKKEQDIKTSSISANKSYDYNSGTPRFTGYQAEQTIDFVLNDINRFTALTGRLLETRINSIARIQFSHSRADSIFREADLLAYDDALKSARKLCARAEVKLGKLLYVSNNEAIAGYNDNGYSSEERINTYAKAYGGRGFKISPEVIEFRRNITSEFAIKN